jgi:hypothetical protein
VSKPTSSTARNRNGDPGGPPGASPEVSTSGTGRHKALEVMFYPLLLLLVAGAIYCSWKFFKYLYVDVRLSSYVDFSSFYYSTRGFISRQGLFQSDMPLGAPPLFGPPPSLRAILALTPIPYLDFDTAVIAWLTINLLFYLASLYFLYRLLFKRLDPRLLLLTFMAGMASFPAAFGLGIGQINILILFLIILTLASYVHDRKILAGFFLGTAIGIKLLPVFFIPFFLFRREWKLLGSTLFFIILWYLGPGLYIGMSENLRDLSEWYKAIMQPYISGMCVPGDFFNIQNQSLLAVLYRFLTPIEVPFLNSTVKIAVLDIPPGIIQLVARVLIVLTALVYLAVLWPRSLKESLLFQLQYSSVPIFMLIFSGISWAHHFVLTIIPFLACIKMLTRRFSIVTATALLLSFGMIHIPGLLFMADKDYCQLYLYSVVFFGNILLLICLLAGIPGAMEAEDASGEHAVKST